MKLIRVKEAAATYSLSKGLLYHWKALDQFPGLFVKMGRTVYVDETEFLRIARESKTSGPSKRRADGPAQRIEAGVTLMTVQKK